MAQRSPPSSSVFSANPSVGQTLILIASDGVRVSVNRAVATEASYVLRDLLDGQDLVSSPVSNSDGVAGGFLSDAVEPSPATSVTGPSMTAHDLENLFQVPIASPTASQNVSGNGGGGGAKVAAPDLMDFFSVAPAVPATPSENNASTSNTNADAAGAASGCATRDSPTDDLLVSLWDLQPTKQTTAATPTRHKKGDMSTTQVPSLAPPPPPPAEIELDFPYFTGDILERVCRHMSYRFRMSSFGTEDGCYRVYLVKTRPIPRPMTLPLVEYLDMKDRRFISDWDETTTVRMVKAATLLNYEELLHLASAKLASYLIERDLEGVRAFLGVESDFDPVEEAELKKEQVMEFNR